MPFGLIGKIDLIVENNAAVNGSVRIGLRFVTTPVIARELRYYELNYTIPIGSEGGKFSLVASGNQATPGNTLQTDFLGTEIAGERVQLRYSYPFIRSRAQNLVADLSFTWTNAMVDQFTIPSRTRLVSSYEDRIRALSFGLNYDTRDDWGGSDFARLELNQ
jgi:hemolysin activation/secretion protein